MCVPDKNLKFCESKTIINRRRNRKKKYNYCDFSTPDSIYDMKDWNHTNIQLDLSYIYKTLHKELQNVHWFKVRIEHITDHKTSLNEIKRRKNIHMVFLGKIKINWKLTTKT